MSTFQASSGGKGLRFFSFTKRPPKMKKLPRCGLEFDFFFQDEKPINTKPPGDNFQMVCFFVGGVNASPCHGAIFPLLQLSAKRNKATASTPFESEKSFTHLLG